MSNPTSKEVIAQSKNAMKQWGDQWKKHAEIHGKFEQPSFNKLINSGVGKAIVLCANGYSLEQNIEVLKENKENVDIMCCDKSLGPLIENGIIPKYCLVCDANVSYEKYLKPYEEHTEKIILLMNVCANPEWTVGKSWKNIYFFLNQDAIQSEKIFGPLSKCPNMIPAGTNVSNAMIVTATQSSNKGRNNWLGYDKIILLGFDYCWTPKGNYYAFDHEAEGKRFYMKHVCMLDTEDNYVYTSNNLLFSARWGATYIKNFLLPVVNCSDHTILHGIVNRTLESQITYTYKRKDRERVLHLTKKLSHCKQELDTIKTELDTIAKDHWTSFKKSIGG